MQPASPHLRARATPTVFRPLPLPTVPHFCTWWRMPSPHACTSTAVLIAQCPCVRLSLRQCIDKYIALRARGRAAIAPRAPAVQQVYIRCSSNPGRSAGPPDCALTYVGSSSRRRPCCDAHGLVRSVLRLRLAAVERDVVLVVLRLGAGGSVGGGRTAVGGRQKARCGPV